VTVDDLSHLQPPFQEAARLSNAERIHWLRQERWIQYPRAERILERLIDLVDYSHQMYLVGGSAKDNGQGHRKSPN
jgi:hypothetical protein